MNATTRIVSRLLSSNPNGIGAFTPREERTEWTPEPAFAPGVRSTWKDPVGKRLTSRRIVQLQRQGWYGPTIKERALREAKSTNGMVFRCGCGCKDEVRYLAFSYLPKPGYYCPRCVKVHRAEIDREKELDRRWKDRMTREYA